MVNLFYLFSVLMKWGVLGASSLFALDHCCMGMRPFFTAFPPFLVFS